MAYLNAGEDTRASAACEALRRVAPDDPAILQLHATIALRTGRPPEALSSICRCLQLRPDHVPSLVVAARAARAMGALEQALVALRKAVMLAPDRPEPAFLLCEILIERNDPAFAAAMAGLAARFPGRAEAWQALGGALQRAGRGAAALAAFTQAVVADPTLARAHFARGLLLREAGQKGDARIALRRAVTLDPNLSGAWFALGLTCQDLLDETEAACAYEAALRRRENFAEAAANLGVSRQRLGDMDAAMAAYRRAVQIRPDTFGRIAQALTAAPNGVLWLSPSALRRALGA